MLAALALALLSCTAAHDDLAGAGTSIDTDNISNIHIREGSSESRRLSTVQGPWYQSNAPLINWQNVASDASGKTVLAAAPAPYNKIYKSENYGYNWTTTQAPAKNWYDVAINNNATRMYAVDNSGGIYVSTDGGTSWVPTNAPDQYWLAVNCDFTGQHIVAAYSEGFSGIYYSEDFGANWDAADVDNVEVCLVKAVAVAMFILDRVCVTLTHIHAHIHAHRATERSHRTARAST